MTDIDAKEEQLDAGRMTIWEHLTELRDRVIKVAAAVALGTVVAWFFYEQLLDFLLRPYCTLRLAEQQDCSLFVTEPLQAFSLRIEVSVYGAVVLAMPVILWQLWRFVTPGLYAHEKRYAIPFVASALILFAMGASVAYLTLNPALEFLTSVGGKDFKEIFSPDSYIKLIAFMMLAFGAGFEFPVLLVGLQMVGILSPRRLHQFRRQAMVVIVITAAVITPSGDPISMLALAVPMYLFYEISILIGWLFTRRRARRESAD